MKIITFFSFLFLVLLVSCNDEPLQVPDYMVSRTKNQKCQGEESYVRIQLPDSSIYMADSMEYITIYHETQIRGVG